LAILSFRKLDVYRCAVDFLTVAFDVSTQASRGNGPTLDQLMRAATSIPLNIAEAAGRTGSADAARCYAIARGSAMECAAILDALCALQVVEPDRHQRGIALPERIVAMLTKLCR
jgi:four helix bundle protein